MKSAHSFFVVCGLAALLVVPGVAGSQTDKELTAAELKAMVQNMGFETKDLNTEAGKEKVEFLIKKDNFDVWMAAEVSASKRYVWLTVFLGEAAKISDFSTRAPKLLNQNFKVQPCFFYTTDKGNFMLAIAIDNRGVTPNVLRHRMDKLAADVVSTSDLWQGG